jgi:NADH-quinone oxidoreductase subunit N
MSIQSIDLTTVLPTIVVAGGALLALVVDLVARRSRVTLVVGVVALLVAMPLSVGASGESTLCGETAACGYVVVPATVALQLIVLFGTAVVLLMAASDLADRTLPPGESVFLLLASTSGALLVPATTDLVTLIVALEVVSLPTFALVALRRGAPLAAEAAAKAFLFSIASVAVSLYGVALLYGTTGAASLVELAAWADSTEPSPLATVGLVMLLAVIAFKVAAVPFHAWAPDTYQGAAVPVAAYLSVVSKVAGFGALLLIGSTFASWQDVWAPVVAVLAAATLVVGSVVALRQRLAVRLLAWSSIAQAGYVLVPLGALAGAARWEVGVVTAVTLGAFAVVAIVHRETGAEALADYRGLARRSPWLAVSLAFFLAALAGLPPGLIGLFVKVRVLIVPVDANLWWLVAVMAVATVIGLAYYLFWAALLFRRPAAETAPVNVTAWPARIAVAVTLAVTVLLSVMPSLALGLVDRV